MIISGEILENELRMFNFKPSGGSVTTFSERCKIPNGRPKSAPKPITPSSKDRPTRKSDGSTSGIININSNSNRPRSKNRPKRARKKRPSGPPLKGSKDDLLAKRLGLRSFKNTTPQDLQTIMSMTVSVEDAKELGKIAVKEKNWELAEVAYNLCVEKPAYGTEGRHQRGHQQRVSKSAVTSDYPQLSPIKTRERYSRPHTQQSSRSSRSRRRNRTSQTKQMLDYEQNWKKGTAGISWNSTSSRRGSMDSRNSLTLELQKRMKAGGSGSLNATTNFDLWQTRREFVTDLARRNPMWGVEFHQVGDPITQRKILQGFRLIVNDEAFAYRPEVPLLQRYLQLHDGIGFQLQQRAEITNNRSYLRLSFSQNQDLARQWELGVLQLLTFPDFGNVYDRYFSNIESVNTSNLPAYAPATLRTGN